MNRKSLISVSLAALLLVGSTAMPALADTPAASAPAPDSISAVAIKAKPSVVGILTTIKADRSTQQHHAAGTGWVYKDGVIMTNAHVVADAVEVKILYANKTVETVSPTNIYSDAVSDIAVIKVSATGLAPLTLGDSDQVQVGQQTVAVGNPLGFRLGNSVTAGILSGTGRALGSGYPFLQTDAPINPGNSGGPLFSIKGDVIGINSSKMAEQGVEGLGFAIPINTAVKIGEKLLKEHKVVRAVLGISLDEDWQAYFGVPNTEGITISHVIDDGPAGSTALRTGDKLIKLDDTLVYTSDDVFAYLDNKLPGEVLLLTVKRRGQVLSVPVKLVSLDDLRTAAEEAGQAVTGILKNLTASQIQEAAEYGRNLSLGRASVNNNYYAASGRDYAVLYTEYLYVARKISSAYDFGFTPGAGYQQAVAKEINNKLQVQMEINGTTPAFLDGARFSVTQGHVATEPGTLQGKVTYTTSPDGKIVVASLTAGFSSVHFDSSTPLTLTVTFADGHTEEFEFEIKELR